MRTVGSTSLWKHCNKSSVYNNDYSWWLYLLFSDSLGLICADISDQMEFYLNHSHPLHLLINFGNPRDPMGPHCRGGSQRALVSGRKGGKVLPNLGGTGPMASSHGPAIERWHGHRRRVIRAWRERVWVVEGVRWSGCSVVRIPWGMDGWYCGAHSSGQLCMGLLWK